MKRIGAWLLGVQVGLYWRWLYQVELVTDHLIISLEAPTDILVLSFAGHTVIISTAASAAAPTAIQKWIRWVDRTSVSSRHVQVTTSSLIGRTISGILISQFMETS